MYTKLKGFFNIPVAQTAHFSMAISQLQKPDSPILRDRSADWETGGKASA